MLLVGKQRLGNRIGAQLNKLNVVGVAGRSTLVLEETRKIHTASRWAFVFRVPTDKNIDARAEALVWVKHFDQRRISARERHLRKASELHLYKHGLLGMCEQCNKRIWFEKQTFDQSRASSSTEH